MNGMKAVPLRRVPHGAEFWSCGRKLVLIHWHDCGASVNEMGTTRMVSLTDRYGNDREFMATSRKSSRCASCIIVEVHEDAKVLGFAKQHGLGEFVTFDDWLRLLDQDEQMRDGTLRPGE
jgi:hypothetical protein